MAENEQPLERYIRTEQSKFLQVKKLLKLEDNQWTAQSWNKYVKIIRGNSFEKRKSWLEAKELKKTESVQGVRIQTN